MKLILLESAEKLSKKGVVYYICKLLDVENDVVNKNIFITKEFYEYIQDNFEIGQRIDETYFSFAPVLVGKEFYYKLTYIGGI